MNDIVYVKNGITHTISLSEIQINQDDLSNEFAMQASKYAYVAQLSAYASSDVKEFKIRLEELEAQKDKYYRSTLAGTGAKVTEGMIASYVTSDPEITVIKRELLKAEETSDLIKAIESAYRMRSDMLIQIGTRQRAEMQQTGIKIREYPQETIIYTTKE